MDILIANDNKAWNELTGKEIEYYNQYIQKVFDVYFREKKFDFVTNGIVKKEEDHILINYESKASGFSINLNELFTTNNIYIMRYYDYPRIDNDFWFVTSTPSPLWTLGFVERIILAIDRYLLDIFSRHDEEYVNLVNDTKETLLYHQNNDKILTGQMIKDEQEVNLHKGFYPQYFSFSKRSTKEIREAITKLLNEEVS